VLICLQRSLGAKGLRGESPEKMPEGIKSRPMVISRPGVKKKFDGPVEERKTTGSGGVRGKGSGRKGGGERSGCFSPERRRLRGGGTGFYGRGKDRHPRKRWYLRRGVPGENGGAAGARGGKRQG